VPTPPAGAVPVGGVDLNGDNDIEEGLRKD
jgi:hypothetical protein